jgi:energy-coupling factor transporter transmembrane protein EcfT
VTVDQLLNWLLPIHCNWFILFVPATLLVAIVAWIWTYTKYKTVVSVEGKLKHKFHPIKTLFRGAISFLATVLALVFFAWIIYADNRPVEIQSEERLEIKPVVYPNGRVVQMFSCGETNYNANSMFQSSPPSGSYVRRVIYKRVYVGVYFSQQPNSVLNDGFFLVTPDNVEKKANVIVPDRQ